MQTSRARSRPSGMLERPIAAQSSVSESGGAVSSSRRSGAICPLFRRFGRRLLPVFDESLEQVELALDARYALAQLPELLVHLPELLVHLIGQPPEPFVRLFVLLPELLVHLICQLPEPFVRLVGQLPEPVIRSPVPFVHSQGKGVDPAVEPTALLKNQPDNGNAAAKHGSADAKNGDEFGRELLHKRPQ